MQTKAFFLFITLFITYQSVFSQTIDSLKIWKNKVAEIELEIQNKNKILAAKEFESAKLRLEMQKLSIRYYSQAGDENGKNEAQQKVKELEEQIKEYTSKNVEINAMDKQLSEKQSQLSQVDNMINTLDKQIKIKNTVIEQKESVLNEKNQKIKELGEQNKSYLSGFRWVASIILIIIIVFMFYGVWNMKFSKKIPEEIQNRFPKVTDPFIKGIYLKYIIYLKLSRLATSLLFLFVSISVILFSYVIVVVVFNNTFNNVEILINNKFWDFILASGFPLAFVTVVYNTVETKRGEVEMFIMDRIISKESNSPLR